MLALAVVVLEIVGIVFAGLGAQQPASPIIHTDWSGETSGCGANTTTEGVMNYTVYYSNFIGPSGYAVMELIVSGHLARYWSTYVAIGAFNQQENSSLAIRCDAVASVRILLAGTLPS